jgi:hypothetical protein
MADFFIRCQEQIYFALQAERFFGDVQRCSGQYMNGYSDIQKKELL